MRDNTIEFKSFVLGFILCGLLCLALTRHRDGVAYDTGYTDACNDIKRRDFTIDASPDTMGEWGRYPETPFKNP